MRALSILSAIIILPLASCYTEVEKPFMEMVKVEGGSFQMGATPEQEKFADEDEFPVHTVILSDYSIGKYEVTVRQFAQFVEEFKYITLAERGIASNKSWINTPEGQRAVEGINWRHGYNGELLDSTLLDYPVTHISWIDAMNFCYWLSHKEGRCYTLPTEAQWEFAARGGNKSEHFLHSGSNDISEVAVFFGNSVNKSPTKVGTKKPNELGIYDMNGNVSEYCLDSPSSYQSGTFTDPVNTANKIRRVVRGGAASRYPKECRISERQSFLRFNRGGGVGFRVVLVNDSLPSKLAKLTRREADEGAKIFAH